MKLDEYTNTDRENSFCYWIEKRTEELGSIWGGSSYKFGIYKRKDTEKEDSRSSYKTDGEYAWTAKYGPDRDSAFKVVKQNVIRIIEAAISDKLIKVDSVDMGEAYKWKIAAMYNKKIPLIYKASTIEKLAQLHGIDKNLKLSELYRRLGDLAGQKSIIQFSRELWNMVEQGSSTGSITESGDSDSDSNGNGIKIPLNQILFGPPGTGKTYHSVNKALEIIKGKEFVDENSSNRTLLMQEFNRLKGIGQVEFVTFHQSFSYEDFVEGIKPILNIDNEDKTGNTGDIQYEIREGIFKRMCSRAKGISSGFREKSSKVDFDNAAYYKMSIGGMTKPHIHDWCIKNNKLALGWGGEADHTPMIKYLGNWNNFRNHYREMFPDLVVESKYHIQAMYLFLVMKKGDVVLVSKGNKIIDAIGIIKSDKYIFDDTRDFGYYQFREVEWLATDMNASPELFVKKNIMMQSIYQFYDVDIKKEYFKREFSESPESGEKEKYVLIIDEINRGNVASIFGELITLIEEDKRIGAENQLLVRLPYSGINGENFGVPDNLYLVGTMNTADRSIEALDTALRRRFSFEEMSPEPELLKSSGKLVTEGKIVDIDVVNMLKTINNRIEKLIDKDHKIGHSYFMNVEPEEESLRQVFKDKVIPLLEEYFYGDFGKIGLVLGSSFVEKVNSNGFQFATFPDYDDKKADLMERSIFRIKPSSNWDFKSIYS